MKAIRLSVILLSTAALTACGSGKNSPDEFAVVDRPPLVVPPEAELKPPRAGEPKAQDMDPGRRAFEALFPGKTYVPSPPKSKGEQGLLARIGFGEPDVRSNAGQEKLDVVKKTVILGELLELGERQLRPDNVEVERISTGSGS